MISLRRGYSAQYGTGSSPADQVTTFKPRKLGRRILSSLPGGRGRLDRGAKAPDRNGLMDQPDQIVTATTPFMRDKIIGSTPRTRRRPHRGESRLVQRAIVSMAASFHSARSASAGSTAVARRTGAYEATIETTRKRLT